MVSGERWLSVVRAVAVAVVVAVDCAVGVAVTVVAGNGQWSRHDVWYGLVVRAPFQLIQKRISVSQINKT